VLDKEFSDSDMPDGMNLDLHWYQLELGINVSSSLFLGFSTTLLAVLH
jgi:hypothetical protein